MLSNTEKSLATIVRENNKCSKVELV